MANNNNLYPNPNLGYNPSFQQPQQPNYYPGSNAPQGYGHPGYPPGAQYAPQSEPPPGYHQANFQSPQAPSGYAPGQTDNQPPIGPEANLSGYGYSGNPEENQNEKFQPPPPSVPSAPPMDAQDKHFVDAPSISAAEAKDALSKEADKHTFWKKAAISKMDIKTIEPSVALFYKLESFVETRSTAYVTDAFFGQPIVYGAIPPGPWDLPAAPAALFADSRQAIDVPNTTTIIACTQCHGNPRKSCFFCNGRGHDHCTFCNGSGRSTTTQGQCISCHGRGHKECFHCSGRGFELCKKCQGSGRLRRFLRLTIDFKNNVSDFLYNAPDIPEKDLKSAKGRNLLQETYPMVQAIRNYPVPVINDTSVKFLNEHYQKNVALGRLHQQRQTLCAIPISHVTYVLNGETKDYFVFGEDRKVYIKSYPDKCCIL